MKVYTFELGRMSNCSYIVENNGEGIIIDPSWEIGKIEQTLKEENIKPVAVIFTHGHYDHLTNAEVLLRKYNLKGYIERSDRELASNIPNSMLQTFEGDYAEKIAGLPVIFMHTPGHTPGSCCIHIESVIFTGDTLFPGACGRTDLPGSSSLELGKSLERLSHLIAGTVVYSGHAYGGEGSGVTTIGDEVKNNPFIKLAVEDPDYFESMI